MPIEKTRARLVAKPWDRADLRLWNVYHDAGVAMGEAWFERTDAKARCSPCSAS
jgi:hypothetical protein